eukprot:jgi/Picre1/31748/NNA_007099.t1
MAADPRAEPRFGERIPYVVVHGEPGARLIDMVVPPENLVESGGQLRLHAVYYITKQIIPALERFLSLIGADRSIKAIIFAQGFCRDLGSQETSPEHILLGLMAEQEQEEQDGYLGLGVDSELALALLKNKLGDRRVVSSDGGKVLPQDLPFSSGTREVFQAAQVQSRQADMSFVTPEHILLALIDSPNPYVRMILNMFKASNETLRTEALKRIYHDIQGEFGRARQPAGVGSGNETKDTSGEDTLKEFCRDLCQNAQEKKIDPVIGRLKEVNRVAQILARRTKNNPILLGDPGVGKTAIAEGLACAIVDGALPDGSPLPCFLRNKRLLEIDVPLLIAGSKERGELELRYKHYQGMQGEWGSSFSLLTRFIPWLGADPVPEAVVSGSSDIGNLFKPALSRGEIVCIGATTLDEHRKYIESDAALERRFQPIIVEEPSDEDT